MTQNLNMFLKFYKCYTFFKGFPYCSSSSGRAQHDVCVSQSVFGSKSSNSSLECSLSLTELSKYLLFWDYDFFMQIRTERGSRKRSRRPPDTWSGTGQTLQSTAHPHPCPRRRTGLPGIPTPRSSRSSSLYDSYWLAHYSPPEIHGPER